MIRYVLHFCLVAPERLLGKAAKSWEKDSAAALKPLVQKMTALGDCEAEVTADLLEFFRQQRKAKARVNSPWVEEQLVEDERTPLRWFVVDPHYEGEFDSLSRDLQEPVEGVDDLPAVKADRMRPGAHVAGWELLVCVSERFKAVVEADRLTGIEFVWCRDVGKYQAPQWYLPVCHKVIGRGLDHPWIDTKKLSGAGHQTLDPRGRHGQTGALPGGYRADAGSDHPVLKNLLPLLKSMELLKRQTAIHSFHRYLRKYLPESDFAATVLDTRLGDENVRHRGLAMNRKARDILLRERVITESQYRPVQILDKPPKGVKDLDRKHGPAEPAYSPEQMSRIRELAAAAWTAHMAKPKPPRVSDLAKSLSLLRARQRRTPTKFAKPAAPKALAAAAKALGAKIPADWQKVLRLANGGKISSCALADGEACMILSAQELAETRDSESAYYRGIGGQLTDSSIPVIRTELGDSVWVDANVGVVLMSHETGQPIRQWAVVADFLEGLLTDQM